MNDATKQHTKKTVYGLWFVRERDNQDDVELLVGIYESELDARDAINRLAVKPGFADFPSGFQIHPYELGRDGWLEGFIEEPSGVTRR